VTTMTKETTVTAKTIVTAARTMVGTAIAVVVVVEAIETVIAVAGLVEATVLPRADLHLQVIADLPPPTTAHHRPITDLQTLADLHIPLRDAPPALSATWHESENVKRNSLIVGLDLVVREEIDGRQVVTENVRGHVVAVLANGRRSEIGARIGTGTMEGLLTNAATSTNTERGAKRSRTSTRATRVIKTGGDVSLVSPDLMR